MNKPNDELNKVTENEEVTEVKEETEVNEEPEVTAEVEEVTETEEKKPKKKKRILLKIILWILAFLLACIIALGVTVFIMIKSGEKQMTNYEDVVVEVPDIAETLDDGKIVKYNGKKYILNENVVSILGMGVDRSEFTEEDVEIYGKNGQADTIFLVTLDTVTGEIKIIALSRDTMTEIDMYSESGNYAGIHRRQLCLAYSYGDGRESSCENMVKAVERMIYGIPINSYFAIDIDAIASINDAVGGVTVKSIGEFKFSSGKYVANNQTVTLHGEEAMSYVRSRSEKDLDANRQRMKRQVQYVQAFADKTLSMTKSDISTPIKLFNAIKEDGDLVSNLNSAKISYLTECIVKHGSVNIDFINVDGEIKLGENKYAEFYPDETKFFEIILDVFYTELENEPTEATGVVTTEKIA